MEEKRMSVESPPETLLGSGFRPKDEEIVHYLRLKKAGKNSQVDNAIAEVDFYKSLPWDLPHKARLNSDDRTWHFFHRQVHMGNKRIKRKTPTGTWKVTGNDRKIKDRNGKVIGSKRYFVFLPDGGLGAIVGLHGSCTSILSHPIPLPARLFASLVLVSMMQVLFFNHTQHSPTYDMLDCQVL